VSGYLICFDNQTYENLTEKCVVEVIQREVSFTTDELRALVCKM
jgi:hypothetical protein